jgi:hypothetical protein
MNRITAEEFTKAVIEAEIFPLRECSFCSYTIGYVFYAGRICLDTGCDCVTYGYVRTPVTSEQLEYLIHPESGWYQIIEKFVRFDKVSRDSDGDPTACSAGTKSSAGEGPGPE